MTTKPHLIFLDACVPGFFQGYSGDVYAVPVDGSTTRAELESDLRDEIQAYASLTTEEMSDADWQAVENSATEIFDCEPNESVFPMMEDPRDEEGDYTGESCYAYFGLVIPKDEPED